MLSKSVTATLPGALLVIFWWQRGKLSWRRDVLPLIPFFAVGIGSGLFTAWVERIYGGAEGAPYALGAVQRCLLAGRVVWFYLAKIFWPANLIFIYPRWEVSAAAAWQWLFPLALVILLAVLWALRRRTRTPLAGMLFFIGTLFPALGFFNVYPFLYSYVADHFQYLAMMGIVAVTVGGGAALFASALPDLPDLPVKCLSSSVFQWLVVLVACVLAALTFRDCRSYRDAATLYRATIAKNSRCWMAHTNLGVLLAGRGRLDEAIGHYRAALAIDPSLPNTHNDLGSALFAQGKVRSAESEFEAALRLRPAYAEAIYNLGIALQAEGRTGEAIDAFFRALRLKPDFFEARYNLAITLGGIGRVEEALPQFEAAVRLRPGFAAAHHNLGVTLRAAGRPAEAEAEFTRARKLGFSP